MSKYIKPYYPPRSKPEKEFLEKMVYRSRQCGKSVTAAEALSAIDDANLAERRRSRGTYDEFGNRVVVGDLVIIMNAGGFNGDLAVVEYISNCGNLVDVKLCEISLVANLTLRNIDIMLEKSSASKEDTISEEDNDQLEMIQEDAIGYQKQQHLPKFIEPLKRLKPNVLPPQDGLLVVHPSNEIKVRW